MTARDAWVARRWLDASALLASARDIIDERPEGPRAPAWCTARGWTTFLDALPDDAVLAAERDGLAATVASMRCAPVDLVALADAVRGVTALPAVEARAGDAVDGRRASPRKRSQVASFASIVAPLARGRARVVDVGSGHGHLTRHLARALDLPAEGWERDAARVAVAAALSGDARARFVTVDARALAGSLEGTDLVVGLHACGELGDHAVAAASAAGASVALIGCCLQKRGGDRPPLAAPGETSAASLTLGRAVLGLGNARDGDDGVEDDLAARTASRVNRNALRDLLRGAGAQVAPGEEMRGVNRRRAIGGLGDLAARAFAVRGLRAPSVAAVDCALRDARADYERARRLALPRAMLARLVEVWVALDRAALLLGRGYAVDVAVAFDAGVSPRNVAVLGRASG